MLKGRDLQVLEQIYVPYSRKNAQTQYILPRYALGINCFAQFIHVDCILEEIFVDTYYSFG